MSETNKGAKLSIYMPSVEGRMLEDMSNKLHMTSSSVVSEAISRLYPQAMMKVKFSEWALAAIINKRFDLLNVSPADSDGIVYVGTDFVEIPGSNGKSGLIGMTGSKRKYDYEADKPVIETWSNYKELVQTVRDGVKATSYVVHMLDSSTGEVFMETCDSIDVARDIASRFYDERALRYKTITNDDYKFIDNVHHKDVYTLKFNGNVVVSSITPV